MVVPLWLQRRTTLHCVREGSEIVSAFKRIATIVGIWWAMAMTLMTHLLTR